MTGGFLSRNENYDSTESPIHRLQVEPSHSRFPLKIDEMQGAEKAARETYGEHTMNAAQRLCNDARLAILSEVKF